MEKRKLRGGKAADGPRRRRAEPIGGLGASAATSKELQSSNEELQALNDELNNRNLELGQTNSDLLDLISSVRVPIVIVGRDLRMRRFSPTAETLLNISPTDRGRPITDINTQMEITGLDALLTEVIDTAMPTEREVRARDGRWYSLRVRPYQTLDNKIDGAVLMLVDVDTIRSARQYAEGIIGAVRDPLVVLDADLRVRTANRSFYDFFCVVPEETEGCRIFELGNHQWNIPELRRLLETVLPAVAVLDDVMVEHEFEQIGRKTMRLNARTLKPPGEESESIVLAFEDITEYLRLEAAARQSAEKFKLLFERSPLPKWTLEIDTLRVVDVNEAAVALYGHSREDFLRMNARDLCTPEALEAFEGALAGPPSRMPQRTTSRHRKRSGQVIDVEMRVTEIELAGERVSLVAVIDITERNRADEERARLEAELRKRAEELEGSNRDKADFIAVLSHELRTPLNAICGWAEILSRPDIAENDLRRGLEVISRNGRMQAQLLSDLLDASRIATGKLSLDLRTLDLRGEVGDALEAARPAAEARQIRLEAETDPAPVHISADAARLQQVLGNLLSNAIKFTPAGGVVRATLRHNGDLAEVSIRDTGQGISPESLKHIFGRFRQSESLTSRVKGGLGLGLAVSKDLVELHGGEISAQSAGIGQGATFTVAFPLTSRDARTRAAIVVNEHAHAPPVSLTGYKVLVVDDEPEAREPVRRVLEAAGAEVVAVRSADEALEAIQQQRPDVLVSDIRMPGRDGYDLIRAVRALPDGSGSRVPAVALTAFATKEDRERALGAGYSTHLVKPVEPAALIAAIADLL